MVARNQPPSRRPPRRARSHPAVFALLWLDSPSASALRTALEDAGLHSESLESSFHLTVYHARRSIPGLRPVRRTVAIECDLAETRTMVLVPGGENPRRGVIPGRHSLALRLTTRNVAVPEIQALRAELTQMETDDVLGARAGSTRRRNAFGARHYQPHLRSVGPGTGLPRISPSSANTSGQVSTSFASATTRSGHLPLVARRIRNDE